MIRRTLLLVLLLAGALVFAACGPEDGEPVAVATRTPRPTFTPTPFQAPAQPVEQAPVAEQPTAVVVAPADTAANTPVVDVQPTEPPSEAPTNTPEPATATPAPQEAKAVVNSPAVNVRSGPGTEYALAGTADRGAELTIQAKNAAGDWWQVCCVNGQTVWIASFLVDTSGPVDGVAVAANIPAPPPPTATPVPQPAAPAAPTATPVPAQPAEPTQPPAPPAPTFRLNKAGSVEARPNSNSYVSFFGWICKGGCPSQAVGGYKMVAEGPAGRLETVFEPSTLVGDPGLASEFWYNAKLETPNTTPGTYRVWVEDMGGNQVAEAWELVVQGNIRTFFPRWFEP